MRETVKGLHRFFQGSWLLVARPRLLGWALVPILLTGLLLLGLVIGVDVWLFAKLGEWFDGDKGWWAPWLRWALFAPAATGMFLLAYLLFWIVRQMVAAPFNDVLSLRTERTLRRKGGQPEEGRIRGAVYGEHALRGMARAVTDTLHVTAWEYTAYLLCLPFLLIPVVGIVPLWVAHAFYAGLNALDIALACRGYTLSERKRIFKAHRLRMVGVGIGMALFDLTVLLAIVSLPASVIGGTLVVMDLDRENRLAPPDR
jgi:CysZ protein